MQSLWMLVASLLFALMGACVKLATSHYGVAEIVFYRSLVGCVALAAFVRWRGLELTTPVPWAHLRRGVAGTAALWLWFHATTALPLGTAMTLNYASSLYVAGFAVVAAVGAGRRLPWRLAATVLVGFGGVLLVLQPSIHPQQAAAGGGAGGSGRGRWIGHRHLQVGRAKFKRTAQPAHRKRRPAAGMHRYNSLPGFIRPRGSSARLTECIRRSSTADL